jgi:hypothetical protein
MMTQTTTTNTPEHADRTRMVAVDVQRRFDRDSRGFTDALGAHLTSGATSPTPDLLAFTTALNGTVPGREHLQRYLRALRQDGYTDLADALCGCGLCA